MGWDFRAYLCYSTNAEAEDDIRSPDCPGQLRSTEILCCEPKPLDQISEATYQDGQEGEGDDSAQRKRFLLNTKAGRIALNSGSGSVSPEGDTTPGSSVQASAEYNDPTSNPGLQAFAGGAADNQVPAPSTWPDLGFDDNQPSLGPVTDPNQANFLTGVSTSPQQPSTEDATDSCSYWGQCP